jgi:hypothetical protein
MLTARKWVAAGLGGSEVCATSRSSRWRRHSSSTMHPLLSRLAFAALTGPHPPGKLALINER